MARHDFVPVTADDWYQRRRDDAEGAFFRRVADQGPRKGAGGSTRQGIYLFTAAGKLLAYKNAGQAPDVMRDVLKQALKEWDKLPAAERRPGGVRVEALTKEDARYTRRLPEGGLVVDVFTRILDRDGSDGLGRGTCATPGGERAARDHLWLTAADVRGLTPAGAKAGDRFPVPPALARRIARFHLVDNTRGEPPLWRREDVRSCDLTLTVEEAGKSGLRLRLDGSVLLAADADPAKAARGYHARLLGYVHADPARRTIDRFDVVAVGDHWGEGTYTGKARPGRQPLGVAFALAAPGEPGNAVPPQGARELAEYLGKGE